MRDIMMEIYNVLIADAYVAEHVGASNIKFYAYPEVGDINSPYIVIDEIDGTLPVEYADDKMLRESELIQLDVYTVRDRILCKNLDEHIKQIIWDELGMYNTSNSKPEYDKDYKIYRRASRFEGAFYNEKIN